DARNPVWQQDIAIFESARVQQLQAEVERLQRQPEMPALPQLEALRDEVAGWRGVLPGGLAQAVQEMFQRIHTSHWQGRLRDLAQEMRAAVRSKDEHRARELIAE